jgi:hypothetical protein
MKRALSVPILALSIWLTGCAAPGPSHKDLAESDRAVTAGRDVVVAVPQSEVKVNVARSNLAMYSGGGLLVGLIDVAIEKHRATVAEDTVTPIRDALVDYDFDKKALETVKQATGQVPWFSVNKMIFTKDGTNENFAKLMDGSTADQLMYNYVNYAFSSDFRTLYVGLKTGLIKRNDASRTETARERMAYKNAAYFNAWVYHETLPGASDDASANAKVWADNNGERARAALDRGLANIGNLLVKDLTRSPGEQPAQAATAAAAAQPAGSGVVQ